MKAHAKRCTARELAYLSYWRRHGFNLAIDDKIPLSTVTPPSLATRRPVLDALIAGALFLSCITAVCTIVAYAAGIVRA